MILLFFFFHSYQTHKAFIRIKIMHELAFNKLVVNFFFFALSKMMGLWGKSSHTVLL